MTTALPAGSTEAAAAEVVSSLVPVWLQFPGYRFIAALLVVGLGRSRWKGGCHCRSHSATAKKPCPRTMIPDSIRGTLFRNGMQLSGE